VRYSTRSHSRSFARLQVAGTATLATVLALGIVYVTGVSGGAAPVSASTATSTVNGTVGAVTAPVSTVVDAPHPAIARPAPLAVKVVAKTTVKPKAKPKTAKQPSTPKGLPSGIEDFATYVGQTSCQVGFRSGTRALARLLVATYPNTTAGGEYACGTDGTISEHYDGRALDWMNSARTAVGVAQANAVLHWLLTTDKAGNKDAIARRLGVMYVIWNNRIWSAYDQQWEPYQNCAKTPGISHDSYCHRNHIHISLSWDGALGRTSFFSKHVFDRTDYGPCRAKDLNWAAHYTRANYAGCTVYSKLTVPRGSSPTWAALRTWSGDVLSPGSSGPAVAAVQAALHIAQTSTFDSATTTAVLRFKRAHKLPGGKVVDASTWRNLIAVTPRVSPKKKVVPKIAVKPTAAVTARSAAPPKPTVTQPTKPQPVVTPTASPKPVTPEPVMSSTAPAPVSDSPSPVVTTSSSSTAAPGTPAASHPAPGDSS
jgi:hypothetical protein